MSSTSGRQQTVIGGSDTPWDERTRLQRSYVQVDRQALKGLLRTRLLEGGGLAPLWLLADARLRTKRF